jgi:hypothetical protein
MPSLNSEEGWISSDPPEVDTNSSQEDPGQTVAPTPKSTATDTGRSSPLGTKVAEVLFDSAIVVGVIGGGLILWRKM